MLCATAEAAHAWAWDSNVTLQGHISCPAWGGPFDHVNWMYVQGNTGDAGWAWLGGGYNSPYSFAMHHVPGGSEYVIVSYGCSASGSHSTGFGVSRPAVGTSATRNIY
jgi:hypothetical protein